jgi:hemolysin activation/secretion protein
LFYAGLTGIYGHALDTDNLTQLGGDTGLRGYPLRYQAGDSSALLTIEQRYFTDWYPFQLFNVGGAVFADIGRTWGNNPVGDNNLGLQRAIGFGLRLGNTRSALGRVVHIDLAFPLDGATGISNVQFLVGTKSSF